MKKKYIKDLSISTKVGTFSFELIIGLMLSSYIGKYLDNLFSSYPIFLIMFICLSLVNPVRSIINIKQEYLKLNNGKKNEKFK